MFVGFSSPRDPHPQTKKCNQYNDRGLPNPITKISML
jgi:hypothetical protein